MSGGGGSVWDDLGPFVLGVLAIVALAHVWSDKVEPEVGPRVHAIAERVADYVDGLDGHRSRPLSATGADAALDRLVVAAPVGTDTYDRGRFGSGWIDEDHDGCNTRAEVLMRDLTAERVRDDASGGCMVLSGRYRDPYTGIAGDADATVLDIDHVVALGDAWDSGASTWSDAERVRYANDMSNLLAASASVNRSKGDDGPDQWEPPGGATQDCNYAKRYVTVKDTYRLTVTQAEHDALVRLLALC